MVDVYGDSPPGDEGSRGIDSRSSNFERGLLGSGIALVYLTLPTTKGRRDQNAYDKDRMEALSLSIHTVMENWASVSDYLENPQGTPIWLEGMSFGGTLTAYYALYSRYSGDFDGYFCLALFSGWRPPGVELPPTGQIFSAPPQKLTRPLVLVHGTADYVANIAGTYRIIDVYREAHRADLLLAPWIVREMRHSTEDLVGLVPKIVDFLHTPLNVKKVRSSDQELIVHKPIIDPSPYIVKAQPDTREGPSDAEKAYREQFFGRLLTSVVEGGPPESGEVTEVLLQKKLLQNLQAVIENHRDSNNPGLKKYALRGTQGGYDLTNPCIAIKVLKESYDFQMQQVNWGALMDEVRRRWLGASGGGARGAAAAGGGPWGSAPGGGAGGGWGAPGGRAVGDDPARRGGSVGGGEVIRDRSVGPAGRHRDEGAGGDSEAGAGVGRSWSVAPGSGTRAGSFWGDALGGSGEASGSSSARARREPLSAAGAGTPAAFVPPAASPPPPGTEERWGFFRIKRFFLKDSQLTEAGWQLKENARDVFLRLTIPQQERLLYDLRVKKDAEGDPLTPLAARAYDELLAIIGGT